MDDRNQPLSASLFYMWRALLAIAWADGECGQEETDYFAKVFDTLPRYYVMTQDQRNALADALERPEKPEALFPYINDPEVRAQLVVFARDLVALDGVLDPGEEAILRRLHLWDDRGLDRAALMEEVRGIIAQNRAQRAAEKDQIRQEIRGMSRFYAAMDVLLMRLGIDLIE